MIEFFINHEMIIRISMKLRDRLKKCDSRNKEKIYQEPESKRNVAVLFRIYHFHKNIWKKII